jgi:hypothetical protein
MKKSISIAAAGLTLASVLVASAGAVGSTAAARWKLLPKGVVAPGDPLLPLGWASGRVWFWTQRSVYQGSFKLVSARVRGRRLTSLAKSNLRASGITDRVILGSSILVYPRDGATQIAELRSNGKIGGPHPLPGDPEAKAKALFKKDFTFRTQTAATVGGRTVWVMERARASTRERPYMAACCTTSGEARDLTSLLSNRKQGVVSGSENLGVDSRGRLRLFWTDCVRFCRTGRNRAVRLDRETLAPGAPSTASQQVESRTPRGRLHLVCAAVCRAVFGGWWAIQSWDGQSPPKRIAGARGKELMAAGYRRGKLIIAYEKYFPEPRIVVRKGNAKGLHLRTVRSTKIPLALRRWSAIGSPRAAFTPRGVVAVQGYGTFDVSRYATAVLR